MYIKRAEVHSFRNLSNFTIEPISGINLFVGDNAQGKSSLLEALALLSTGRSFRTLHDLEMVQYGSSAAYVQATVENCSVVYDLKVALQNGVKFQKKLYMDGKSVQKLSQFIQESNSVCFSRLDLQLVTGAPEYRRAFLDRLLSLIDKNYLKHLQNYVLLLKQKNALLKSESPSYDILELLNMQLSESGAYIIVKRFELLEQLSKLASKLYSELFAKGEKLELSYISQYSGRSEEIASHMLQNLKLGVTAEIQRGFSMTGPHRDDLQLNLNGKPIKTFGSQGQQRFVAIIVKIAEGDIYSRVKKSEPVIFMDDCFSELDLSKREQLWNYLQGRGQIFLTANEIPTASDFQLFQLEAGKIVTSSYKGALCS